MIVITGPGRSGTSALALLYESCGFPPGGHWSPAQHAGLEDERVVAANEQLAHDLGMTMTGPPRPHQRSLRPDSPLAALSRRLDLYHRLDTMPGRRARRVGLADWDRLPEVVARRGDALRDLAAASAVVKDPRFTWTLPVWLAAGADVSHVVLTSRNLDAMLDSRLQHRLLSFASRSEARNSLIYGIGMCLAACWDHSVPHTLLRFPDFVTDLEVLHGLPLLRDVAPDRFRSIAEDVIRPDLVHHG